MSVKNFRFVSPGIFINEIDKSQLAKEFAGVGPVVIGRSEKGPALTPVQVETYLEFLDIFGDPIPGGKSDDVWRNGNYTAPTYAAYAAKAWLRNATPLTFVRLLGDQHSMASGTNSNAGWATEDAGVTGSGAYGLFVAPSATSGKGNAALAAVIYNNQGPIGLKGYPVGATTGTALIKSVTGSDGSSDDFAIGQWVQSNGKNYGFTVHLHGVDHTIDFDASGESEKFIRSKLNTNPTLTNSEITPLASRVSYFLGETYERHVANVLKGASGAAGTTGAMAVLLPLKGAGSAAGKTVFDKNLRNIKSQAAATPWIFSQDSGGINKNFYITSAGEFDGVTNLFKFYALSAGSWASANLKVVIEDIKAPENDQYGTFTVAIREASDSDNIPVYVERFTNCNLNINSSNFVAQRIGDMHTTYVDGRFTTQGNYVNVSKIIRVHMNDSLNNPKTLVPFGFYGPSVPRAVVTASTATGAMKAAPITGYSQATGPTADAWAVTVMADSEYQSNAAGTSANSPGITGTGAAPAITLVFPAIATRADSAEGNLLSGSLASFGVSSNRSNSTYWDPAYADTVKPYSEGFYQGEYLNKGDDGVWSFPALSGEIYDGSSDTSFTVTESEVQKATGDFYGANVVAAFTLDDLILDEIKQGSSYIKNTKKALWKPGARFIGASISARGTGIKTDGTPMAATGATGYNNAIGSYRDVIDLEFNRFSVPLFGGFDGLDITEKEPFRNTLFDSETTEENNYAYYSIKRAINSIADPEVVEMNLATIPGCTNSSLTTHLINVCEARGDALAIIDLEKDYQPSTEGTTDKQPSVAEAVTALKARGINSSYGCAYFPWVQIRDNSAASLLWAPPSVVALGTMASAERKSELWFAPAGFNRGGLTEGSAGLPVSQVRLKLTSKDRDKLYEANINPIASFPSEGIVIFGQKTLQITPSALDRINVRRLLIYLKKEVSRIATGVLFDNNLPATWQRFTSRVEPFLSSVKSRFGLSDFKVVLDETTTTPDLVDRNVLYAKVLLKPARSIEFIAIDFVISKSGASFDD